jgi:phosphoribosylglycinamide formyltransferase-1
VRSRRLSINRGRKKANWAVFISGRGSNLGALLDLRDEVHIQVVVSSYLQATGLLRARRAGGITLLKTPLIQRSLKIDYRKLSEQLRTLQVSHIMLAGFMKVLPAHFVEEWQGRILNIHPSLLPQYPGLKSIERAFSDHASQGITVHEVTPLVDQGRFICQRQTVAAKSANKFSLEQSEFLIHVDEQRVIREVVRRWPNQCLSIN